MFGSPFVVAKCRQQRRPETSPAPQSSKQSRAAAIADAAAVACGEHDAPAASSVGMQMPRNLVDVSSLAALPSVAGSAESAVRRRHPARRWRRRCRSRPGACPDPARRSGGGRALGRRGFRRRRLAAQARGPRRGRPLHEELGGRRRRRVLLHARGPGRRGVSGARRIGIEIEAVNFAAEYKERVFASFLAEYRAGRTPNPDVLCNAEIKFKAFLDHALRAGRRTHRHRPLRPRRRARRALSVLLKGLDPGKDQSYFLHRLDQAQLARTLFPVGHLHKSEVRGIAREAGLAQPRQARFHRHLLHRRAAVPRVPRRATCRASRDRCVDARRRARRRAHRASCTTRIGQRQGLGIGGRRDGAGEPWYVAGKDLATNTLIVVQGHDHPLLLRSIAAGATRAGSASPPAPPGVRYGAKTRYRQADAACELRRRRRAASALDFAAPAVGGDAGPVGRGLPRRGVPRRRRDHRHAGRGSTEEPGAAGAAGAGFAVRADEAAVAVSAA